MICDAFQTEKYAKFWEDRGCRSELREGNLFLLKRKFGLTYAVCAYPSTEIGSSVLKDTFCEVRESRWKLPKSFVNNCSQSVKISLDGPNNVEKIWASLRKHNRNAIRQAEKRGTWFTESKTSCDEVFMNIYEQTASRKDFKMVKKQILVDYLDADFCKTYLVGVGEKTIGAYAVFEGEGVARYYAGGFLYDFQQFRPNNFAHWNIILHYVNKGFSSYDMGRCGEESYHTWNFKTDFGKPIDSWSGHTRGWLLTKALSFYRNHSFYR